MSTLAVTQKGHFAFPIVSALTRLQAAASAGVVQRSHSPPQADHEPPRLLPKLSCLQTHRIAGGIVEYDATDLLQFTPELFPRRRLRRPGEILTP